MAGSFAASDGEPTARRRSSGASSLARWQFVRQIGEGEWSVVFQARPADSTADRPADYALKLLKPQFESNPAYVALFRREDYVGRRVSHRHLAPVLASSLKRAPYWLALPYLEGASLEQRLSGGKSLPSASSLWIARQIAEALEGLHEAGWIHGDVKPHNVVLSPHGHATLIDLGFARPVDLDLIARLDADSSCDSQSVLAATPAYAAPETFADPPRFSRASDVYSLGATLFECLTGRRPYLMTGVGALADAHLRLPPPDVRRYVPEIPERVADLVWRMLAKDAAARPTGQRLLDLLVSLEIETFDRSVA